MVDVASVFLMIKDADIEIIDRGPGTEGVASTAKRHDHHHQMVSAGLGVDAWSFLAHRFCRRILTSRIVDEHRGNTVGYEPGLFGLSGSASVITGFQTSSSFFFSTPAVFEKIDVVVGIADFAKDLGGLFPEQRRACVDCAGFAVDAQGSAP